MNNRNQNRNEVRGQFNRDEDNQFQGRGQDDDSRYEQSGIGMSGRDRDYDQNRSGQQFGGQQFGGYGRGFGENLPPHLQGQRFQDDRNLDRGVDRNFDQNNLRLGQRDDSAQRLGQQVQGPHSGKSPKGYKRTDERIKEDVSDRLTLNGHIDPSDVTIEVKNGEVTLAGTVTDRHTKTLIEHIIDVVPGVQDITNNIRVMRQQAGQNLGSSTSNVNSPSARSQSEQRATS